MCKVGFRGRGAGWGLHNNIIKYGAQAGVSTITIKGFSQEIKVCRRAWGSEGVINE